jgi:hypothetical protein
MQKRRNKKDPGLPLTVGDLHGGNKARSSKSRTRRSQGGARRILGYSILLGLILGGFYLGASLHTGVGYASKVYNPRRAEAEYEFEIKLPYSQFTSLEYPLKHSRLVGLYFAASWCPMSTQPTNELDEYFGDTLLPPPSDDLSPPIQRVPLSIVYVSSDGSEDELLKYQRANWISVPFDSDERTGLKKEFSVCAKRELEVLQMERKFEIPTLIILDSETHGILSTNGVEDLKEYGSKALDHWVELSDLVRALEEKYAMER